MKTVQNKETQQQKEHKQMTLLTYTDNQNASSQQCFPFTYLLTYLVPLLVLSGHQLITQCYKRSIQ